MASRFNNKHNDTSDFSWKVKMASFSNIPVIDFSAAFDEDENAPALQKLVADVREAMETVGFLQVAGHRFPKDDLEELWSVVKEMFDLPLEKKSEVKMSPDYPYGYENSEVLNASFEENDGEVYPDCKETFSISMNTSGGKYPTKFLKDAYFKDGNFKSACENYYQSCSNLAQKILEVFALALDLPRHWFSDKTQNHQSALRMLNYPHQDRYLEGRMRAGAHSDWGILALLKQDGTGGLQVRRESPDGSFFWVDVVPHPDAFVLNIGDLFQRWTNDKWKSTVHRVLSPAFPKEGYSNRRQSCVFFFNANPDCLVHTFPTCRDEDGGSKYEPVIAEDYLMGKHAKANQS